MPNGIEKFDHYSLEALRNKQVIDVTNNKTLRLGDALNQPNVFINFWFKGCVGCELEMPEIEQFYKQSHHKIQFAIISNDSLETVQKYVKSNKFTMPFYVFKDDTFPIGISVFPTSHLIINNKTQFLYAGIGYFDNEMFRSYVDSVLVK